MGAGIDLIFEWENGIDALGLGFTNKRTIENGNGIENLSKTEAKLMGLCDF